MTGFFLRLLSMSLTGSLVILAVLLLRLPLRRAPRKWVCLLWLPVLFRLLCPVTLESRTSVVPARLESGALEAAWEARSGGEAVSPPTWTGEYEPAPSLGEGPQNSSSAPEAPVAPSISSAPAAGEASGAAAAPAGSAGAKTPGKSWLPVLSWVWLAGVGVFLLWGLGQVLRLRLRLREAVRLEGNVYEAEGIDSPFVLGILRPRIYLPWGLREEARRSVLLHERAHLGRLDPVWKLLGWLTLGLHWYNPLCWLAFRLAVGDLELACDEAVLASLGEGEKKNYSRLLLELSAGRPLFTATPLGCGEGNVKNRIRGVLRWTRPRRWVPGVVLALLTVVVLLLVLGPKKAAPALGSREGPEVWPERSFFTEEWTEVRAGTRGVWPVKDGEALKEKLAGLFTQGDWALRGIPDDTDSDRSALFPGKFRWVSAGKTWEIYLGSTGLCLVDGKTIRWFGCPVTEDGSVDASRLEAILALTELGEPELTLTPGPELTLGPVGWDMSLEEAQSALPEAKAEGNALTLDGASLFGFRVRAVYGFGEDGGSLDTVTLSFQEEAGPFLILRFDRPALAAELETVWGTREESTFTPSGGDARIPEPLWYWQREVPAEGNESRKIVAYFERTGDPRTLILAKGRELPAATPSSPEPEPTPLPHYPVEEGWTLIGDEELARWTDVLSTFPRTEDGSWTMFDENGNSTYNLVGCCFTSFYKEPADLDLHAFLKYYDDYDGDASEEEYQLLLAAGKVMGRRWSHVEDLPHPLRRIRAETVEARLQEYFGIGLSDLRTDYRTQFRYLPETDCFYSVTSDFGPGVFTPGWGETQGDTVRLWSGYTSLTLRVSGEDWKILSYWNAYYDPNSTQYETPVPRGRNTNMTPEVKWVFTQKEAEFCDMEEDLLVPRGVIGAGERLTVLEEERTPEGEIWFKVHRVAFKAPEGRDGWVRGEQVIPWTEMLYGETLAPVYVPAGTAYYPLDFSDYEPDGVEDRVKEEYAASHAYDLPCAILEVEGDWARVGVSGGMELWVLRRSLQPGTPDDEPPDSRILLISTAREVALEQGYPLLRWGAELYFRPNTLRYDVYLPAEGGAFVRAGFPNPETVEPGCWLPDEVEWIGP